MKMILLMAFMTSCSTFQDPEREKILQAWKGKTVAELEVHSFFSKVPLKRKTMEDNTEIRNYEERGKYSSKARNQSLGGGMGIPTEVCQNIFTIKDGIIQKYEMKESCLSNPDKMP